MSEGGRGTSGAEETWKWVPARDREAFRVGLYTTVLLLLALLCGCGVWAIYHLLFAFLKPMMWAVLVGTVLFPVKRHIAGTIKTWMASLRNEGKPLVVGVCLLPVNWLNSISDTVFDLTFSVRLPQLAAVYVLIRLFIQNSGLVYLIHKAFDLLTIFNAFIDFFSSKLILIFIFIYSAAFIGWLAVQTEAVNRTLAQLLSLPIWALCLLYISHFCGPFSSMVFLLCATFIGLIWCGMFAQDENTAPSESEPKDSLAGTTDQSFAPVPSEDPGSLGDSYLRLVFYACAIVWITRNEFLLFLLLIPLFYALIKKFGSALILGKLSGAFGDSFGRIRAKTKETVDICIPQTIRDFARLLFEGDTKVIKALEDSMDLISSAMVMVGVLLGSLLLMIFVAVQLHNESIHIVSLVSNLVSSQSQARWVSAAINFTDEKWSEHNVEQYIEQGFQYGRTWVATKVRTLADPSDPGRADLLEAQVKLLVDNVYSLWQTPDTTMSPHTAKKAQLDIWSQLSTIDIASLGTNVVTLVQENIGMLMTVLEQVWNVISANVSLLGSVLAGFLGLILDFGMELLNIFIQLIIFLTMLFYLLSYSTDQWKPMEWLNQIKIAGDTTNTDPDSEPSTQISNPIETAIRGVFVLTTKMSLFYGLYTWLIHALFNLNIVFIPSASACIFAAVPLTAPYWVALVGVAELWLVRQEAIAAVVFFLCSFAPTAFVTGAFYEEVKGSHPYMTGLAIIGGMYWLGLEGAIIGPIILCSALVIINLFAFIF